MTVSNPESSGPEDTTPQVSVPRRGLRTPPVASHGDYVPSRALPEPGPGRPRRALEALPPTPWRRSALLGGTGVAILALIAWVMIGVLAPRIVASPPPAADQPGDAASATAPPAAVASVPASSAAPAPTAPGQPATCVQAFAGGKQSVRGASTKLPAGWVPNEPTLPFECTATSASDGENARADFSLAKVGNDQTPDQLAAAVWDSYALDTPVSTARTPMTIAGAPTTLVTRTFLQADENGKYTTTIRFAALAVSGGQGQVVVVSQLTTEKGKAHPELEAGVQALWNGVTLQG